MQSLKEKAKAVKIIFFDIDDTLRVRETGFMPKSVNRAFAELRQKGILTGIATGRNFEGVISEIKALGADYYVTSNGTYVENKQGEVIFEAPMAFDLTQNLVNWLQSVKSEYLFYGKHHLLISNWGEVEKEALYGIYGDIPVAPDFYLDHPVYSMVSVSDHDDQLTLPVPLAEKVRMVRWHPHSSDIIQRSVSKAVGTEKVLEQLGLTRENLMNFGDGLNDREIFELAGLSVAMKISHPEILEKADFVTDSVENDGILKALQYLKILD